jgi:acetolactate synthase small subunit
MNYCLRILVLNRPAVLARVAGQVARRGVNIDHFTARNVEDGKTVITIGSTSMSIWQTAWPRGWRVSSMSSK